MADLQTTIPTFPLLRPHQYTHLLPSLEKHLLTTIDLLTLDPAEIARRAQVSMGDVRRLVGDIIGILGREVGVSAAGLGGKEKENENEKEKENGGEEEKGGKGLRMISTLDDGIDGALGGGVPTGYVTEFTGESGTGKTQFLLTLLLSAQLPAPHGLARPTLYISTEHPLPTSRLTQLLATHPRLRAGPSSSSPPSLSRILTLQTPDLESQDHILTYQLPVALARHRVGLCIIDSVAANYRAERPEGHISNSPSALAYRSTQLVRLGTLLRSLARIHDCAIVVANQVSDRFPPLPLSTFAPRTPHHPPSSSSCSREKSLHAFPPVLTLDYQQRFFTGWGDHPSCPTSNLKTPSLGPVWTNQIACRIALIKEFQDERTAPHPGEMALLLHGGANTRIGPKKRDGDGDNEDAVGRDSKPTPTPTSTMTSTTTTTTTTTKRWMRVVFAPWVQGTSEEDRGVEYEVWSGGIRAIK